MTESTNPQTSSERYDHTAMKMVAIVSSRIEPGVAINTVGHMTVALGASEAGEQLIGSSRQDGSGQAHAALARFPLIVLATRPQKIKEIIEGARLQPGVTVIDYPEEGYITTHDDDYAAALASKSPDSLVYIGTALFGPREVINELCAKLTLWKPQN